MHSIGNNKQDKKTMIQRDDMGWEGGSGLGTHVHPWRIHVNVCQNQYNIVKQNKVKIKIKKKCGPFLKPLLNLLQYSFSILKFIFNWRVAALQCCIGFCHTTTCISHKYAYIPSFLSLPPTPTPSLPSRLSQSIRLSSLYCIATSH